MLSKALLRISGDWSSFCCRIGLVSTLIFPLFFASPSLAAQSASSQIEHAFELSASGSLREALEVLDGTLVLAQTGLPPNTSTEEIEGALLRVDVLRRLGLIARADNELRMLERHLASAPEPSVPLQAATLRQRALLLYREGGTTQAQSVLQGALESADALSREQQARLLNDLALVEQRLGYPDKAYNGFTAAADRVRGSAVESIYRINATRALLEDGRVEDALVTARRTLDSLDANSPAAAQAQIAVANLYRKAVNEFAADARYRLAALRALQAAGDTQTRGTRTQSLVNGHSAELYFDDRQYDAAASFARRALADAEQAQASDLEYRWHWVLARALGATDDIPGSLAAYASAVESLRSLRNSLEVQDPDTFASVVQPLYYEYADTLLARSASENVADRKATLLRDARSALEELKLAEVQDYFQEQCVGDDSVVLDQLSGNAAVLYPVMLSDRLELLLTTGADIQQITVPATRKEVVAAARDFRLNLQVDTGTEDYLALGRKLYDVLIAPLEPVLSEQGIDTLVFVPDGALRSIPLAALHNGEEFLIQRYALATTPGLTLLNPKPFTADSYSAFAGGLSESVQGFSALPSVPLELGALQEKLSATVLKDSAFTLASLRNELTIGDYSVVHLATHGQFGRSYRDSFLLTYDDRLQIDELGATIQARSVNSEELELLVLSACETAAGDDRAALGLAGVAIKAGARSALATLWEVDDAATLEVIQSFYAQLLQGKASKARSLQQAQVQYLQDNEQQHPSQWAPFLLIGNWL